MQKSKGYVPDLTYLKDAPETSLAHKLLRSATGESPIPPSAQPTPATPAPSKEKLQELIDERRKKRLNRTLAPLQNQITVNASKLQAAASLSREIIFKAGVSALPPKEYQRVAKSTDRLRKERKSRKPPTSQTPQSQQPRAVAPKEVDDYVDLSDVHGAVEFDYEEFEEEGSCLPTFSGPQEVSSGLYDVLEPIPDQAKAVLATPSGKYPILQNLVSSFAKRKYADYVPISDKEYTQTPRELGAVKEAKLALAHNPHYPLPQRDHTLRIIESAVATQARARAAPAS